MRESKFLKANQENLMKLLSIPVIKEFEMKDLEGLLRVSKIRQYKAGETIIKEGDMANTMIFFLVSGKVKIVKNHEDISILHRRGDLFGEMGLIKRKDRSASVIALEDTVCLTTDSSYISRLSGNDKTAFCYILFRGLSGVLVDRLRETDDALAKAKAEISRLKKTVRSSQS